MYAMSRFLLLLGFTAVPTRAVAADPPTEPADIIR